MATRALWSVFMMLALLALSPTLHAASEAESNAGKNNGSYTTSVPIAVPAFHGLEPKLSLAYDSGGGNGLLGVGWRLNGFSVIEPFGPTGPADLGTPVYHLDGEELVPCAPISTSPSCTTAIAMTGSSAGFYSTKNESFVRIQHVLGTGFSPGLDDVWHVWLKDGTRLSYTALAVNAISFTAPGARWGLNSVRDTHGNVVLYNWHIEFLYDATGRHKAYARPQSVAYNGATIKFYYEPRPDEEVRSIWQSAFIDRENACGSPGGWCLANDYLGETIRHRLKSIDVLVGGARARAYLLEYTTSGGTGRSLLNRVQMFGSDASVDPATGVVTGPSVLPPTTFGWPAAVRGPGFEVSGQGALGNFGVVPVVHAAQFNGNRTADFLIFTDTTPSVPDSARYYRCLDGVQYYIYCTNHLLGFSGGGHTVVPADFNGDGYTDLLVFRPTDGFYAKWYSDPNNPNGDFIRQPGEYGPAANNYNAFVIPADFNGDTLADFLYYRKDTGYYEKWYSHDATLSTGFDRLVGSGVLLANAEISSTDLSGDRRSDFVLYRSSDAFLQIAYGDPTAPPQSNTFVFGDNGPLGTANYGGGHFLPIELNGDGLGDLLFHNSASGYEKWYHLSPRGTFQRQPRQYINGTLYALAAYAAIPTDLNYDARGDIVIYQPGGTFTTPTDGFIQKWYGTGTLSPGFVTQPSWTTVKKARLLQADLNGDNRLDLVAIYQANPSNYPRDYHFRTYTADVTSANPVPDLLSSIDNGTGGTTTITYTPSNRFINVPSINSHLVLQAVTQITQTDGRGGSYTTNLAYEEPLFDLGERLFRGFRKVTITKPGGAYTELYYHQRYASSSKVRASVQKDSTGNVYSYECIRYSDSATPCDTNLANVSNTDQVAQTSAPYRSLPEQYWSHACDGAGTCKRRATFLTYDAYANVTREYRLGDYDASGDETVHVAEIATNPSAYVVNKPYYSHVSQWNTQGYSMFLLAATRVYYDNNGTLGAPPTVGDATQECSWLSTTGGYVCTSVAYDSYGNVTGMTDARGNAASQTWDTTYHTVKTSVTNALGHTTRVDDFDPGCGVATRESDVNGNSVDYRYDPLCRLERIDYPDGGWESTSYLDYGSPGTQRVRRAKSDGTVDGYWSETYFDGLGRTHRTVSEANTLAQAPGIPPDPAGGIVVTWEYDTFGRLWKKSNPHFANEVPVHSVTEYDAINRTRRITNPLGGITTMSYGVQSGVWCVTSIGYEKNCYFDWVESVDPVGKKTRSFSDARGNGVAVGQWDTSQGGFVYTLTGYSLMGRLVRIQDAEGNVTTYTYDSLGRRYAASDPDLGGLTFAYDANGNLTLQIDAKGQRIKFDYDAANRLTVKTFCANPSCVAQTGTVTNYYDELSGLAWPAGHGFSKGRLTRQVDSRSGVTKAVAYDAMGRVEHTTTTIDATSYTFHTVYDAAGRPSQLHYPDGEVVTTQYDAVGRALSLAGASQYVSEAQYTARSELRLLRMGDFELRFEYNALGLPTSVQDAWQGIQSVDYTYHPNGQIQTARDYLYGYESVDYVYDSVGRLTHATHLSNPAWTRVFSYSPAGRITHKSDLGSYVYGAQGPGIPRPHAPRQVGSWTDFSYDHNGNMLTGAGRTFSYDESNRPITIGSSGGTTTFTYDGDGQRVKKVEGGSTTITVNSLYEVKDGVPVKYYAFGGKVVARRVGLDAPQWFISDRQGGVQQIVDQGGSVLRHQMFLPFGQALVFATNASETRDYTGHHRDASGLLYMQARYYDPIIGQFTSPDSLRQTGPQQLNPYAYVSNDPMNLTDPTGHMAAGPVILLIFALNMAGEILHDPGLAFFGKMIGVFATGAVTAPAIFAKVIMAGAVASIDPEDEDLTRVLNVVEATTLGAVDGGVRGALANFAGSGAANALGLKGGLLNMVSQAGALIVAVGVDQIFARPPPAPPNVDEPGTRLIKRLERHAGKQYGLAKSELDVDSDRYVCTQVGKCAANEAGVPLEYRGGTATNWYFQGPGSNWQQVDVGSFDTIGELMTAVDKGYIVLRPGDMIVSNGKQQAGKLGGHAAWYVTRDSSAHSFVVFDANGSNAACDVNFRTVTGSVWGVNNPVKIFRAFE